MNCVSTYDKINLLAGVIVLQCCSDDISSNVGLRLQQLGADVRCVEKIDRLKSGLLWSPAIGCGNLSQAIRNVGRKCYALERDAEDLCEHLSQADIVIYDSSKNSLLDLGYDEARLRREYPRLILAEYSCYGSHSVWCGEEGDELLAQAVSGVTNISGDRDDPPTPLAAMVGTSMCASHLTHAILAALVSRGRGCAAAKVSGSLLESLISIQSSVITTSTQFGFEQPPRAKCGNAHAYLGALYGRYESADGEFALAALNPPQIAALLGVDLPAEYMPRKSWLIYRDEIMSLFAPVIKRRSNREWLELFEREDIWCSTINRLPMILDHEGYKILDKEQRIELPNGDSFVVLKQPYKVCKAQGESDDRGRVGLETREVCVSEQQLVLDGLLVVDFSQYLSAPSATLLLSNLGATVVKIERPKGGDSGRNIFMGNVVMDGESSDFLTINRGKYSFAADLKDPEDREMLRKLIAKADIVVHNFRPEARDRVGLDYASICAINPAVIYAEVSGYGERGCWAKKAGQDLILQAMSGLAALSGDASRGAIPMGISIVDIYTGARLTEAIMGALYSRDCDGVGAHIELSMLASAIDLQSDIVTRYRFDKEMSNDNDECRIVRSSIANIHPYAAAPAGIYRTKDSYIAIGQSGANSIAGVEIQRCDNGVSGEEWRRAQDSIKEQIAEKLMAQTTDEWIEQLMREGVACKRVYSWQELFGSDFGRSIGAIQSVSRGNGYSYDTTRCPFRYNDEILHTPKGAPYIGEDTEWITERYELNKTDN